MKPRYAGGTVDLDGWQPTAVVLRLEQLQPGQIVLSESEQFQAQNLARITRIDNQRGLAYAIFVDPQNTAKPRDPEDREFSIWAHELNDAKNRLTAVRQQFYPGPPPGVYEPLRDTTADLVAICRRANPKAFSEEDRPRVQAALEQLERLLFPEQVVVASKRKPRP